jgi:hypothetical protein
MNNSLNEIYEKIIGQIKIEIASLESENNRFNDRIVLLKNKIKQIQSEHEDLQLKKPNIVYIIAPKDNTRIEAFTNRDVATRILFEHNQVLKDYDKEYEVKTIELNRYN